MDTKPLVKKIEETVLELRNASKEDGETRIALGKKVASACENLRGILTKDEADHQIALAITRANKKYKKANK